ncbi:MAG: DUF5665 domain-containing protein [Bacillota bacterium]
MSVYSEDVCTELNEKTDKLLLMLERSNIREYVQLLQRPWKLVYLNFIAGLARGFGVAIGLTIIASIFLMFLSYLANLNLPLIGTFIAKIVRIVNKQLVDLPRYSS